MGNGVGQVCCVYKGKVCGNQMVGRHGGRQAYIQPNCREGQGMGQMIDTKVCVCVWGRRRHKGTAAMACRATRGRILGQAENKGCGEGR